VERGQTWRISISVLRSINSYVYYLDCPPKPQPEISQPQSQPQCRSQSQPQSRRISRDAETNKGKGIGLKQTKRRHRTQLANILDTRGQDNRKNWLELGHYIVQPDDAAALMVDRCHESYYGGYLATDSLLRDLELNNPYFTLSEFIKACEDLNRPDWIEYLKKNNIQAEFFFDMSEEHRKGLSTKIERRHAVDKYWKDFADRLDYTPEEIQKFQEYKKRPQQYSPTEELIEQLIQWKEEITIDELMIAAIAIERRDVHDLLEAIIEDLLDNNDPRLSVCV
jgi:hypothetical protein